MKLNFNNDTVNIVEVGPRDGLQNEKVIIDTESKLEFIRLLSLSGLKTIECSAFVKKEAIPQMFDSKEVLEGAKKLNSQINFPVLVPNLKGLEAAIHSNVNEVAFFTATSESFTKKNINSTIDESINRLKEFLPLLKKNNIRLRGYISTVFGCPYEKETSVKKAIELANLMLDFGAYEISFGDTIGVANPIQVQNFLSLAMKEIDSKKIAMHFHDTKGLALTNILVSLESGIRTFDSSVAGIGGCPYAKGATGNVATEDIIYLFNTLGLKHGVDIEKLTAASEFILKKLNKSTTSKYLTYLLKNKE